MSLNNLVLVSDHIDLVWIMLLKHFEVASLFLLRTCILSIFFFNILEMRRGSNFRDFKTSAHNMRKRLFLIGDVDVLFIFRLSHQD